MLPHLAGKAKRERASAFVEKIKNRYRFDIICLQEVFDETVRHRLCEGLKDIYPGIVDKASDNEIFNEDSGLFFASKFPVLRHTYREFYASQPWTFDAVVDKGLFVACLKLGSGKEERILHVYNTHLQSTLTYSRTREKQLTQLRFFIERALKTEKKNNPAKKISALLVGDFNVVGDKSGEYKRMMSLLGSPIDLFRKFNPDSDGFTWNSKDNLFLKNRDENDHDIERLDYIFTFNSIPLADDNRMVEKIDPVNCLSCNLFKPKVSGLPDLPNDCDISDHYGVEAVLEV